MLTLTNLDGSDVRLDSADATLEQIQFALETAQSAEQLVELLTIELARSKSIVVPTSRTCARLSAHAVGSRRRLLSAIRVDVVLKMADLGKKIGSRLVGLVENALCLTQIAFVHLADILRIVAPS